MQACVCILVWIVVADFTMVINGELSMRLKPQIFAGLLQDSADVVTVAVAGSDEHGFEPGYTIYV